MPDKGRRRASIARRRVDVDGVRIHYRVAGDRRGGAPVVVLGAPRSASGEHLAFIRAASRNRLSFALDLPGHGRSGGMPSARRHPSTWLLAWMDRLGFEAVHLVAIGASVGVALDTCRRTPGRIISVAVISPPPVGDRTLRDVARDHVGHASLIRHPGRLAARARSLPAYAFVGAMAPHDLERELGQAQVPVMVFRGEHDPTISRQDAGNLARMAHGAFIDLPGAGRDLHATHAAATAGTLHRWWSSIESPDDAPFPLSTSKDAQI